MTKPVELNLVMISGLTAGEYYMNQEIEDFGFETPYDFSLAVVFVSFRAKILDQTFPVRVWFRKEEASEADWYAYGRDKAVSIIRQLSEAVAPDAG